MKRPEYLPKFADADVGRIVTICVLVVAVLCLVGVAYQHGVRDAIHCTRATMRWAEVPCGDRSKTLAPILFCTRWGTGEDRPTQRWSAGEFGFASECPIPEGDLW